MGGIGDRRKVNKFENGFSRFMFSMFFGFILKKEERDVELEKV